MAPAASSRKKKKRRKRRSGGSGFSVRARLLAVGGALGFVILLVGVTWLRTPTGRLLMADLSIPGGEAWARHHIEDVLLREIEAQGVPADDVRVEPSPSGGATLVRLPAPGPLLDLNLALTMAVEDAGGHVHRGERHEDTGDGAWIEIHVGTRQELTHRVVAHAAPVPPELPPLPVGRLAIVLDDLGHNLNDLTRRALALPAPITFAILPGLRHSERVLTEVRRAEKPAFLHMPMQTEPGSEYDAGKWQVEVGMDETRIRSLVEQCLDGLPGVVGLNNHMGSFATRSRAEMDAVMHVVAERGLVFLDSQTTPASVAEDAALAAGVPSLSNDLFVDAATEDVSVVRGRLEQLVRKARRRGWAIGIGHVNEHTIRALEDFLPGLEGSDVVVVAVTELIHDRSH